MCWSMEASAAFAVAGIAITGYAVARKEPVALTATMGFFAAMEALQAFSYPLLDQCGAPGNLLVSKLAYAHIMLQPFFFNALALHFLPAEVRVRLQVPVYTLCAAAAVFMLFQLAPVWAAGTCGAHRQMCGENFCTVSGTWHMAWQFPYNSWFNENINSGWWWRVVWPNGNIAYGMMVAVIPMIYGAWKITLFQMFFGVVAVKWLTDNHHEEPAIWCLMSFWIAFVIVYSPLRRWLTVTRWPLWGPLQSRAGQTSL